MEIPALPRKVNHPTAVLLQQYEKLSHYKECDIVPTNYFLLMGQADSLKKCYSASSSLVTHYYTWASIALCSPATHEFNSHWETSSHPALTHLAGLDSQSGVFTCFARGSSNKKLNTYQLAWGEREGSLQHSLPTYGSRLGPKLK